MRLNQLHSSTLISRGALLKFLYQDSIGEYYLRCSYGVAWDEEYDKELHKERYNKAIHGERKIYNDFHDGHPIVQERIRWLHKYGRQVKVGRREGLRGWIGVALHGKFQIREELYRSKYETKDGLPVRDPQNDITEVGAIEFTIDEVEGMGHLETNEETGMEYQKIEYEISMTFDNPRSKFEMIIPDGGLFPDKEQWGEKYSLYEADIHLAAAVFATPAPIECGTRGQKAVAVSARGIRRSKRLAASR